MRVLLTGATGFVGSYARRAILEAYPDRAEVIGLAREADPAADAVLDVTDRDAVRRAIRHYTPSHVLNLAGIAAPVAAAADPAGSWAVHLHAPIHLAEAILSEAPGCWLLHVGSGMVYGGTARAGLALSESAVLDPMDVYAATKAAGDLALGAYARRGLKCLRLRPFNHTGPGQSADFAVPAFAMQIAKIEAGRAPPVVKVGNLDAARDFLDVRDVAAAYALAVGATDSLAPGTILNIASGTPLRMADILNSLLAMSTVAISVEQDPGRMRPSDVPLMYGDASAARAALRWTPRYGTDAMLRSVLDHCRADATARGA